MSDYMPGAVQSPQPGGVTLDTSLPPRFVWHITWDKLDANGKQPAFSAVANYLKNVGYCPHIMWNPFTGEMEQYYPASVGSRALAYNDQDGAACIQVEVFFTPGCVVDGIKYATVADTPLRGWGDLLAWADSLGVPRTWPMGAPQWQGNARDVGIWNSQGGHYGHCNSPGDTHTDPGPMPALTGSLSYASESITPQEDDMAADTPFVSKDGANVTLQDLLNSIDTKVDDLPGLDRDLRGAFDTVTAFQRDVRADLSVKAQQIAALTAANGQLVSLLAESKSLSVDDIRAALATAIADGIKVTVEAK